MEMTFPKWLEWLADIYGDKPAVRSNGTMNFRELLYSARQCANMLHKAGVQKGDKVVLWSYNSTEWVISFFGIIMAGGIAVLMNYGLNAAEVTALVKMTDTKWGMIGDNKISLQEMEYAIKTLTEGGVSPDHIFMTNRVNICNIPFSDIDEFGKSESKNEWIKNCSHEPKDTQVLIFTTGTTSMPKAVQLSSYSILNNVFSGVVALKDDMTDSLCDALPLFHSYGLTMMMIWLNNGGCVYIPSKIKAQTVSDIVYQNKVTAVCKERVVVHL